MKKIIAFGLIIIIFSFCSCGNKGKIKNETIPVDKFISNNSEQDSNIYESKIMANDADFSTSINKNTTIKSAFTTQRPDISNNKQIDAKALYKDYFYNHYSSSNNVYLADVTHDGILEMIVFIDDDIQDLLLKMCIYHIKDGKVVKLTERTVHSWREGLFLTSKTNNANFVSVYSGISTGAGSKSATEFYFSENGTEMGVKNFEKYYDMINNDSESFVSNDWSKRVAERYGEGYKNIYYLKVNDFTDYSDPIVRSEILNTNASAVFGTISTTRNSKVENLKSILIKGDWCAFSYQTEQYYKIVFKSDNTYDLYDITLNWQTGDQALVNSVRTGLKYKVDNSGDVHLYGSDEFPVKCFNNATYSENEDILISDWYLVEDEGDKLYEKYFMKHFPDGIDDDDAVVNYEAYGYDTMLLYDIKDY